MKINGSLFEGLHIALAKVHTANQMAKGTSTFKVKLEMEKKRPCESVRREQKIHTAPRKINDFLNVFKMQILLILYTKTIRMLANVSFAKP